MSTKTAEAWGPTAGEGIETTLLELVQAVGDVVAADEVVAVVAGMLRSGRARLIGNFRDVPVSDFLGDLATS